MNRLYNFCAGPAALPEAVLLQAQNELLDWQQRGLSVMEMSHRSSEFVGIAETAEADLRDIMGISDDYACLLYTSPSPRDTRSSRMPSSA